MSTTGIDVARGADGRIRCDLLSGSLAARLIHRDEQGVRVALVATVALLLAGDDIRIDVSVGPGVSVEIVETGGTVAHDMSGGSATWQVHALLAQGAVLVWSGLPMVVCTGADVTRRTHVELAQDSVALLRESIVLGRTGERGGDLRSSTSVTRAGEPLLREDLDLRVQHRLDFAILGRHRCLDTLTSLGTRLDERPGVLQLAGVGSIARSLTLDLHESTLHDTCRQATERAWGRPPVRPGHP